MTRQEIFRLINQERDRQDKLHPSFPAFRHDRLCILAEEFGEVAKAINDHDIDNLKDELLQVAAVCVRWLETTKGD